MPSRAQLGRDEAKAGVQRTTGELADLAESAIKDARKLPAHCPEWKSRLPEPGWLGYWASGKSSSRTTGGAGAPPKRPVPGTGGVLVNARRAANRAQAKATVQAASGVRDAAAGRRRGRLVRAVNDLVKIATLTAPVPLISTDAPTVNPPARK